MVQAAGAVGFISKPPAPGQVVKTVSHIISGGTSWS
jgi:DNA-binding NarL/FixJ family response regulator